MADETESTSLLTRADRKKIRAQEYFKNRPPKPARDYAKISDLPRWARMALVEYETQDTPYRVLAKRYGKSGRTLEKYGQSPAGRAWRAEVAKTSLDPVKMSEIMLRASATGVTVEYLMALQSAIDAGDYREVGVMSRDILDRLGVRKADKSASAVKPIIHVTLGAGATLEALTVQPVEVPGDIFDAEVVDAED